MAGYHIIVRTGFGIHGLTQHQEAEWGGGVPVLLILDSYLLQLRIGGWGGGQGLRRCSQCNVTSIT